ncbi:MAG TPA: RICIN domain-containing protein [Candidatus Limnocylindrales bacterium]|nr:RICIN domain-containing protein [Candidatus Limnocylindrales bacterium]
MSTLKLGLLTAAAALSLAGGYAAAAENPTPVSLSPLHSGLCLEIENASSDYGAFARQATCTGATHQLVRFDEATGHLVMEHSGMCLEVSTRIISEGAPIWQAPCTEGAVLQVFQPSGPLIRGESVTIVTGAARCLDVEGGSFAEGARVVQITCDPNSPSQIWKVLAGQ